MLIRLKIDPLQNIVCCQLSLVCAIEMVRGGTVRRACQTQFTIHVSRYRLVCIGGARVRMLRGILESYIYAWYVYTE